LANHEQYPFPIEHVKARMTLYKYTIAREINKSKSILELIRFQTMFLHREICGSGCHRVR